jgi:hypothetical protein
VVVRQRQRFHLDLGHPLLRLLFLLFFTRRSNSYVEVDDTAVHFRMGPLFRQSVPLDGVEGARVRHWHWLLGWGWRYDMRGTVGLIGKRSGVVEVTLREPLRVRLALFPLRCNGVAASVEDAEGLIAALQPARRGQAAT